MAKWIDYSIDERKALIAKVAQTKNIDDAAAEKDWWVTSNKSGNTDKFISCLPQVIVSSRICTALVPTAATGLVRSSPVARTAILKGQYEAAKSVNRVQLAVYFSIGKYISHHTRQNVWGTHALAFISERLRKELPGLRGYSENSLKNMRKFYEAWQILDANVPVATDGIQGLDFDHDNSTIAIAEMPNETEVIDIHCAMSVPNAVDFPVEDFFRIPFTHHVRIIEGTEELLSRYYYIHRAAEESFPVRKLESLLKDKAHLHQAAMPNNFGSTIH